MYTYIPVAIFSPRVIQNVRLATTRRKSGTQTLAKFEVLEIHSDVHCQAASVGPIIGRESLSDRSILKPSVITQWHRKFALRRRNNWRCRSGLLDDLGRRVGLPTRMSHRNGLARCLSVFTVCMRYLACASVRLLTRTCGCTQHSCSK